MNFIEKYGRSSVIWDIDLKVARMYNEIRGGLVKMLGAGPCVTVFGSCRTKSDDKYYGKAMLLGRKLADAGLHVITGGGPGIMEAANRGAYSSPSGKSIGFSIELGLEKEHNEFLDVHKVFNFFFTRKYMMMNPSFAYVIFPGGVGTLDEFFEIITLLQTGKAKPSKVFLVGEAYYSSLIAYMNDTMLPAGMINKEDLALFELTDDISYVAHSIIDAKEVLDV